MLGYRRRQTTFHWRFGCCHRVRFDLRDSTPLKNLRWIYDLGGSLLTIIHYLNGPPRVNSCYRLSSSLQFLRTIWKNRLRPRTAQPDVLCGRVGPRSRKYFACLLKWLFDFQFKLELLALIVVLFSLTFFLLGGFRLFQHGFDMLAYDRGLAPDMR